MQQGPAGWAQHLDGEEGGAARSPRTQSNPRRGRRARPVQAVDRTQRLGRPEQHEPYARNRQGRKTRDGGPGCRGCEGTRKRYQPAPPAPRNDVAHPPQSVMRQPEINTLPVIRNRTQSRYPGTAAWFQRRDPEGLRKCVAYGMTGDLYGRLRSTRGSSSITVTARAQPQELGCSRVECWRGGQRNVHDAGDAAGVGIERDMRSPGRATPPDRGDERTGPMLGAMRSTCPPQRLRSWRSAPNGSSRSSRRGPAPGCAHLQALAWSRQSCVDTLRVVAEANLCRETAQWAAALRSGTPALQRQVSDGAAQRQQRPAVRGTR